MNKAWNIWILFVKILRHDILRALKLKHYDTLEASFQCLKVEADLKEEKLIRPRLLPLPYRTRIKLIIWRRLLKGNLRVLVKIFKSSLIISSKKVRSHNKVTTSNLNFLDLLTSNAFNVKDGVYF